MGIKKTGILKGGIHCSVLGSTILDPDGRSHFYPELHPWQLDLLSINALGCRWENVKLSRAKVCRLSLPTPLSPIITCHFSAAFQFVALANMANFCKHVDAIDVHPSPSIMPLCHKGQEGKSTKKFTQQKFIVLLRILWISIIEKNGKNMGKSCL